MAGVKQDDAFRIMDGLTTSICDSCTPMITPIVTIASIDENSGHTLPPKDLVISGSEIRGRKYYWHSQNWKQYEGHNNLDHRMKQRIRPIKKSDMETGDRLFCFRVYFDRLNQKELESLRWSLDFADRACAHKLGRGKPLGFGSVKIYIEDLKLQHMDRETGEIKLLSTDFKTLGIDIDEGKDAIKTLKLMANYENIPVNISYPEADDNRGKESFRWFVNNRVGGSGMQTSFEQILPKALEVCGDESDEGKWLKVNRKR